MFQDPSQSFRANLGSDDEFVGGIQGTLGNMGLEYVKEIYLEHNGTHDAETEFTAYNAGHVLKTKARRVWELWWIPTAWISSSGLLTWSTLSPCTRRKTWWRAAMPRRCAS